jgi:hypothetical protein
MGGGDSGCGNGNYKKQAKSNLVRNWMHKTASWNHKHESLCLTPSLLLDYNLKHELELDLWESKKLHKEKLHARKEKKMARVKPYEKT